MTDLDVHQRVLDWLSKQGYPFELKVGQVFAEAGWFVDFTRYYEDPVTSKVREIDIFATHSAILDSDTLLVHTTIECKTSAGKPWVVMASTDWFPRWTTKVVSGMLGQCALEMYSARLFGRNSLCVLSGPTRIGHGVLRAFHETKTGDPSSAYAGIQGAVNAAVRFAERSTIDALAPPQDDKWRTIDIVLPIVVTDGLLFEYSLSSTGSPELVEVPQSCVLAAHPLRADELILVYIVSYDALPTFVKKLEQDTLILADTVGPWFDEIFDTVRKRLSGAHTR